ncbi:MAG: hypothetical protein ACI8P3_003035 [Saprospiraceae bacterium]|jgi:hypothetical protein
MNTFLKKYKAFLYGLVITIILGVLLEWIGFIRINKSAVLENILIFSFWWIVISLLIYKFSYLKKKRKVVYRLLGLLVFFLIINLVDSLYEIPDSPVVIPLAVIFWITVSYVMFPDFFKKYQKYILGIYLLAIGYFIYVRTFSADLETYLEHEKGSAMLLFVLPIPFFLLLWIYEQWRWLKALKAEKAKAELALLKSQINPHFFFNTLNNLHALTVKNSKKAPEVILKLSDMMRYTIYEGKKETVSLKEEIAYLNNYIELHKIRYHKKVSIEFTEQINGNPEISPLLFIVLLENAFKHGVETLTENAFVKMNLTAENHRIHFTIENNFDPEEINGKKGIGLENLKRRLALIYPDKHQFVNSKKDNIFVAELSIETE